MQVLEWNPYFSKITQACESTFDLPLCFSNESK